MEIKSRDEIELKYQWDLSKIFATDEIFEEQLEAAKGFIPQISAFQGKISQDPQELLAYLKQDDEIGIQLMKLVNYSQRKSDQDTRVGKYQEYVGQVMSLYVSICSAAAWFTPELLTVDEEKMTGFYAACPELELYRRSLDRIFKSRAHTLSPAEEALLASAGEMAQQPDNIYSLLSDADMVFPSAVDSEGKERAITQGSYVPLLYSQDRTLRKSAFEQYYSVYRQFRNSCAAILSAQMKQLKFFADARKFPNTLAAALHETEVPEVVYTNLIDAVHRNMGAMHKYTRLRRKLLDVDELHFYDLYVPVVGDVEMSFTYEEACDLMLKALAPLGEDYCAVVKRALEERWIDVYENTGKRSGAYSAGAYGIEPYILLNFHGTLNDVFTLVHEMGHSMHTYLSCGKQPVCYSSYPIFVAEVASTVNEALLMQYLLKTTTDPRQRAYLVNYFLEQFRTTLYRQVMFAEFELEVNRMTARGEGMTADALDALYGRLNQEYFGEDIVLDDQIKREWARIPHFYYNYYVYQYATGYAAAIALSEKILAEGETAVEDYVNFLSGGCSKTPIELLRGAGVDMATAEPIDAALKRFDALIDEMDALVR